MTGFYSTNDLVTLQASTATMARPDDGNRPGSRRRPADWRAVDRKRDAVQTPSTTNWKRRDNWNDDDSSLFSSSAILCRLSSSSNTASTFDTGASKKSPANQAKSIKFSNKTTPIRRWGRGPRGVVGRTRRGQGGSSGALSIALWWSPRRQSCWSRHIRQTDGEFRTDFHQIMKRNFPTGRGPRAQEIGNKLPLRSDPFSPKMSSPPGRRPIPRKISYSLKN